MTTPIIFDRALPMTRLEPSVLAAWLGTYFSLSAASSTLARVSGVMVTFLLSFRI